MWLSLIADFRCSFSVEGLPVQNDEGMSEHIEGLIQSVLTNAELSFILNQAQMFQHEDSAQHDDQNQMNVANVKEEYENILQSERDMFINVVDNLQGKIVQLEEHKSQTKCLKCVQTQANLQKMADKHQSDCSAVREQYETDKKTLVDSHDELLLQKVGAPLVMFC